MINGQENHWIFSGFRDNFEKIPVSQTIVQSKSYLFIT